MAADISAHIDMYLQVAEMLNAETRRVQTLKQTQKREQDMKEYEHAQPPNPTIPCACGCSLASSQADEVADMLTREHVHAHTLAKTEPTAAPGFLPLLRWPS